MKLILTAIAASALTWGAMSYGYLAKGQPFKTAQAGQYDVESLSRLIRRSNLAQDKLDKAIARLNKRGKK